MCGQILTKAARLAVVALAFSALAIPLRAQDSDISVYEVTDVTADVTADNAAHARDQAIVQAQRSALEQLLDRLGAELSVTDQLSDDDIATLVQNFEVQSERRSAVRYIGVFTVQFRPNAVRGLLNQRNSAYTESRSPPVVVLPVLFGNGHPVLWEDRTPWRAAWESGAHADGLVPVIVPSGGLEDIAVISTAEAVAGKSDSLKAMSEKYQASGTAVVTLDADFDKPGGAFKIDVAHYDADGSALPRAHLTVPAPADKNGIEAALASAVKKARHQLEKDWREQTQPAAPAVESVKQESVNHLPTIVPIRSLTEWAQIENRIRSAGNVSHIDVIAVQRGVANIEIEFDGSIEALQESLTLQGLSLRQDGGNGAWMLMPMPVGTY